MSIAKRILLVTLALLMLVPIASCGQKTEGKLVMATNAAFPPYEYKEGEEFVGIDVELAEAIAAELGLELVIEDMEFESIITSVSTGKADIGVAGLTVSEERLLNVDFSESYTTASQVVILKKDSAIASPDDLVGKKIGVQIATTGDIYASDIENATVERYNKGLDAVMALKQGKIDAVIIDNEPAKVFASQNDDIKILDEEFTVEEYAIAIAKGNTELLNKVNAAIAKLKESGKLAEIINKYIPADAE